jgi:hypothetical protein
MPDQVPAAVAERPLVACREIVETDLPEVASLLAEGFPRRSLDYWRQGLARLALHGWSGGQPRFGFILTAGGVAVGVLLLIHAATRDQTGTRANISSWYVRPEFRSCAAILNQYALRNRAVTYVNISAARFTWKLIEALGFKRAWSGLFLATTLRPLRPGDAIVHDASRETPPPEIARLLTDHLAFGCIALWVQGEEGCAPFIFRRRVLHRLRLPTAMLIFCPSIALLERFAAPLARALLKRGLPFMLAATPHPLRGFAGLHFPERMPVYIKGDKPLAIGDLSYTEAAIFGM